LQRLQNKVLRTIGNFPRRTQVRDLHMALNLPNVYDYTTNCAGDKQKSYKIMENEHVRSIEEGEARHRKFRRLKLGGGQAYVRSSD
jgi:hypothetical protein